MLSIRPLLHHTPNRLSSALLEQDILCEVLFVLSLEQFVRRCINDLFAGPCALTSPMRIVVFGDGVDFLWTNALSTLPQETSCKTRDVGLLSLGPELACSSLV
jgi:hypothetical protein